MRALLEGLLLRFGDDHLDEIESLMRQAAERVRPVNLIDGPTALPPLAAAGEKEGS